MDEHSLNYWATRILCTADPMEKIRLTNMVAEKWKNNELNFTSQSYMIPDQPYR
jgi:hypothetical protein